MLLVVTLAFRCSGEIGLQVTFVVDRLMTSVILIATNRTARHWK